MVVTWWILTFLCSGSTALRELTKLKNIEMFEADHLTIWITIVVWLCLT